MKALVEGKVFRSYTTDRMVVDFVIPLCNVSTIKVETKDFASRNKKFVDYNIKVSADVLPWVKTDTLEDAKPVGYDQEAGRIEHTIDVREDFDVKTAEWKYRDGVLRVTIMKYSDAMAVPVEGGVDEVPAEAE